MEINEKKRRLNTDKDKDTRKLESSASQFFEKLYFWFKGEINRSYSCQLEILIFQMDKYFEE